MSFPSRPPFRAGSSFFRLKPIRRLVSRGVCIALILSVLLGMIVATPPAIDALHWCSPLVIRVEPQSGGEGEVVSVSVMLTNGLIETLTVESIDVTFWWRPFPDYNFGSMTLVGGASSTNVRSVQLPSDAGDYQMTINIFGQTPTDFFTETCTATGVFTVTSIIPYLEIGAAVTVVAAVVLSVFLRRKRSAPFVPSAAIPIQPPPTPCSVCKTALTWISPENRWYCSTCAQYR